LVYQERKNEKDFGKNEFQNENFMLKSELVYLEKLQQELYRFFQKNNIVL